LHYNIETKSNDATERVNNIILYRKMLDIYKYVKCRITIAYTSYTFVKNKL